MDKQTEMTPTEIVSELRRLRLDENRCLDERGWVMCRAADLIELLIAGTTDG